MLERPIRFLVKAIGRLVKQDDRSFANKGTCQRKSLQEASRKARRMLIPDPGFKTIRQCLDFGKNACGHTGHPQFIGRCDRIGKAQVLRN